MNCGPVWSGRASRLWCTRRGPPRPSRIGSLRARHAPSSDVGGTTAARPTRGDAPAPPRRGADAALQSFDPLKLPPALKRFSSKTFASARAGQLLRAAGVDDNVRARRVLGVLVLRGARRWRRERRRARRWRGVDTGYVRTTAACVIAKAAVSAKTQAEHALMLFANALWHAKRPANPPSTRPASRRQKQFMQNCSARRQRCSSLKSSRTSRRRLTSVGASMGTWCCGYVCVGRKAQILAHLSECACYLYHSAAGEAACEVHRATG